MNDIATKFLLTRNIYFCEKIKETCNLNCIYENELGKTCLDHDTVHANSKDIAKRNISDKILRDQAYEIGVNPKCCGCQRGWQVWRMSFLTRK